MWFPSVYTSDMFLYMYSSSSNNFQFSSSWSSHRLDGPCMLGSFLVHSWNLLWDQTWFWGWPVSLHLSPLLWFYSYSIFRFLFFIPDHLNQSYICGSGNKYNSSSLQPFWRILLPSSPSCVHWGKGGLGVGCHCSSEYFLTPRGLPIQPPSLWKI